MKELSKMNEQDLEDLIDKAGLPNIIGALETICNEKADHVRSNWQDEDTARCWEKRAKGLCNLYNAVSSDELSEIDL